MKLNVNKTHLGAALLGTGIFLGLTGAALVASDKKCNCDCVEAYDDPETESDNTPVDDIPTMDTDTVE